MALLAIYADSELSAADQGFLPKKVFGAPAAQQQIIMKTSFISRAFAALLITTFSQVSESRAAVLFNNLNDATNGYSGVTNSSWRFQRFTTTATDYVLEEVALRLYNPDGVSGGFEFQIWDTSGTAGAPGAQVGPAIYQGSASSLASGPATPLSVELSVELAPETSYYFMVRGTTLQDIPSDFPWEPDMEGVLRMMQAEAVTEPYYTYNSTYSQWSGPFTTNMQMSLSAGAAVPEPGGLLGLFALLGCGLAIRHRE